MNFGKLLWIVFFLAVLALSFGNCDSANADVNGRLWFGIYDTDTKRAQPDGTTFAKFETGLDIGYTFDKINLRPYTTLITLMDEYHDGEGTFHPASIDFRVGLDWNVYKGLHLIGEHSCWHPIDSGGTVEVYNLIKIEWRF